MKIMHVFISMPVGGAEDLVMSFLRASNERMTPEAVCLRELGELGEEAVSAGLPVHLMEVARTRRFSLGGVRKLARWFKEQSVDVVHSHVYNSHQYALPAAWLAGIPCVVHHHKTFNPRRRKRWFVLKMLSRLASCHLMLSGQTRDDSVKALGLDPGKAFHLANSVDTGVFQPVEDKVALKKELGLPLDRPVIGGIASLAKQKNHGATLEMMGKLRDRGVSFHGVICGEGPMRGELEDRIRELKLEDIVNLPGNKRPLHPWMQAMDVLAFPSTWEGQPMVLLQAMACGIPVIASRIEGNVNTLGKTHPGLFDLEAPDDFATKMGRCLEDSAFCSEIVIHEKAQFQKADKLEDYLARLEGIYRSILA